MGALLLGLLLIIGYSYQASHPLHRLRLVRSQGYNIYFKAGISGLVLLAFGGVTVFAIDALDLPTTLLPLINANSQFVILELNQHWRELKLATLIAAMLLLSVAYTSILNRYYDYQPRKKMRRLLQVTNELEAMVILATREIKPLRVVLESGKVYVGLPEAPELERGDIKYVTLLPLLSGYVDEKQKLIFTNNYFRHYEQFYDESGNPLNDNGHGNIKDFSIIIASEQITLVSYFNPEAYQSIRADQDSELTE